MSGRPGTSPQSSVAAPPPPKPANAINPAASTTWAPSTANRPVAVESKLSETLDKFLEGEAILFTRKIPTGSAPKP